MIVEEVANQPEDVIILQLSEAKCANRINRVSASYASNSPVNVCVPWEASSRQ